MCDSKAATAGANPALARVLIVDDLPELRRLWRREFESAGYDAVEAPNGKVALELVAAGRFDLVVSDVRMPQMDGLSLLRILHEQEPSLPVVLVTGSPDSNSAAQARELGAFDFLEKPLSFERLLRVAVHALRAHA